MGNTGANPVNAKKPYQASAAGSVQADGHFFDEEIGEFQNCRIIPPQGGRDFFAFFTPFRVDSCARPQDAPSGRYLEVFLAFPPGGVLLKPVAKPGSEKIVTFCIDVE